ncbi:MAG: GH1 family beta-glucosidase [Bdellovibrionota bacterium]
MTSQLDYVFPQGFVWGSATAAIQIEGAAREGGKGASNWDVFCREHPEKIFDGSSPEVACDHYHRFKEDVRLMKETGHTGYRMSIAWTRIYPDASGAVNEEGVAFYRALFSELLTNGIEPNVTLYHWDLPQALVAGGGWENKSTVDLFVRYARTCFELFGDQVKLWATLNEPGWTTLQSYVTGLHPPNKTSHRSAIQVAYNYILAHTRAVRAFRESGNDGQIGLVLNMSTIYPQDPANDADIKAARIADGVLNRWFIDPALKGRYPDDVWTLYKDDKLLPAHTSAELAEIKADTVDFIGVNYYYPHFASADAPESAYHLNTSGNKDESCIFAIKDLFRFVRNPQGKFTDWGWEIFPEGLYDLLMRAQEYRPGIPVYITENGIGMQESLNDDDTVDDRGRIEFVTEHLKVAHRALQDGVNLKGYYMWALMDNFSWVNGFKKRYGFLFVNRRTLDRHVKASGHWYKKVSDQNGF